jgi:hypothetical protein
VASFERPDLAGEWGLERNGEMSSEVTLGSRYMAQWICRKDSGHVFWRFPMQRRALCGCGCPACASRLTNSNPELLGLVAIRDKQT